METKKQYIQPTVKCVAFKVEQGYASSLSSQKFKSFGISKEEYNFEEDPQNITGSNHFGGYFTGNNDDWD